jgi:hypothetical protein
MTFPAAVTKAPALPARQGSLEVCAHSATTPPTPGRLTTWPLPRTASSLPGALHRPQTIRQQPDAQFFAAAVPYCPKQTQIKNQHCGAV